MSRRRTINGRRRHPSWKRSDHDGHNRRHEIRELLLKRHKLKQI